MSHVSQCHECQAGPTDLEGHGSLSLNIAAEGEGSSHRTAFKCGACGMEWLRTYMGSGVFAWNSFPTR